MKAMIFKKYGPPEVLQLLDVEKPVPKDNEILIKIHAATVTAGDCEIRRFDFPPLFKIPLGLYFGFRSPKIKILGQELSGEIESVGKGVTRFKPGDRVFALTGMTLGAYCEYKCLSENGAIALIPSGLSYEEAAALPTGGLNALSFLQKVHKKNNDVRGQKILINGAGGCIGTYAVQIAKYWGAEVTAVDSSDKLGMLQSIGADRVIDYTKKDFTENIEAYDVIFDVIGKKIRSSVLKSLKKDGIYLAANLSLSFMTRGAWVRFTSRRRVITGISSERPEDFNYLINMIVEGRLKVIIDKRFPLEKLAEAHRYVDTGAKTGNVTVHIIPES